MSIWNIDKYTFFYTWYRQCIHTTYRQFFYTTYRQKYLCLHLIWNFCLYMMQKNIIVYIPYIQYIVNINQKYYLYIFMYYINSTHNLMFTLINYVYIKSKKMIITLFYFPKCSLYQWKKGMMSPQSHMKNIIWNLNFISNHIFLGTFVDNNNIQFTYFLELFDKFTDTKKRAFNFWNYFF